MIMIILNEKKYAEDMLKSNKISKKPAADLYILARYLKQCQCMSKTESYDKLERFFSDNYKDYKPLRWQNMIESAVKKADKPLIRELDGIWITKVEMDVISTCDDEKKRRILFAMLCYAKIYNSFSEKNNSWVNVPILDLFKSAKIPVRDSNYRMMTIHDLLNMSHDGKPYIAISKKNENTNLRITFVDNDSEKVLFIYDLRELGYEYINYVKGGYKRCKDCDILFKPKGNRSVRCSKCQEKVGSELSAERVKKYRNSDM